MNFIKKYFDIILIILTSIRFWSFDLIPEDFYDYLDLVVIFYMIIFIFTNNRALNYKYIFSFGILKYLWMVIIFSIVSSYLVNNQSILASLISYRHLLYWCFYIYLHKRNINPNILLKIMLFVGFVWVFLLLIQQFTFPNVYFFLRTGYFSKYSVFEIRYGVYRFLTLRHHFGMLALLFFINRFYVKFQIKDLILVAYFIIGFYLYATRQFLLTALISLFLFSFFFKKTTKVIPVLFGFIFILLIYNYSDLLFQGFEKSISNDVNSESNLRYLAYNFFLFKNWDGLFPILFGNGIPSDTSTYGMKISKMEKMGLYLSDIGIVGSLFKFGVLYVVSIVMIYIKILRANLYKSYTFLQVFIIGSIILLPTTEYFTNVTAISFYASFFYLVDLNVVNRKKSFRFS